MGATAVAAAAATPGAAESFWILALSSKCEATSTTSLLLAVLLLAATALLHWAFPGGPAWGRYWWSRCGLCPKSSIPGPRGLPVLGSIYLMTGLAHRKLEAEARRVGPAATRLMALSLGQTRLVVSSQPDVAKEILQSSAFADRPIKESAYGLLFHRAIGFAPYGTYWRTLRRIASTHLFCPRQIASAEPHRLRISGELIAAILHRSHSPFQVRDLLKRASLHNVMCSVFGRQYDLSASDVEAEQLKSLVDEGYDILGKFNISDHLPFLAPLDLQGIRARCSRLVPSVNRFVTRILDEHRSRPPQPTRDFVDVLLSLSGPDMLSDSDMIAVLWEMIFRGTDTVAVLIEWVLARLVLHPGVQRRVQEELDAVVGKSRPVAESDMPALPYLQAVVKEVLRVHPPGPLLSWARLATEDTVVDGCLVPAGTTAMVNMWAITRDPDVWAEPTKFWPERFLEGDGGDVEFSVLGSDLRLAPFGSGRRSCPGKALGLATVGYWVASLLQDFEWAEPAAGYGVDLSEVLRLSCEMASPLTVTVRPRRR